MGYEVRRASAGRGLFATITFKRNEKIIQYVGEEVLFETARNSKYLIEVDETTVIDGSCHSNKARYINHSCKPNAQAYIVDRDVFIYARRRIAPGEEITIDYGEDYWKEHIASKGCRCAPCSEVRLGDQSEGIGGIDASAA